MSNSGIIVNIFLSAVELGGCACQVRVQVKVDGSVLGAKLDFVGNSHVDKLSIAADVNPGMGLNRLRPADNVEVNVGPRVLLKEVVVSQF